jgi:hypothetical protein
MKPDDTGQNSAFEAIKVTWGVGILILLLTLAVWIFFKLENMPLDTASTSVVALGATLFVMLGRWVASRLWPSGGAK